MFSLKLAAGDLYIEKNDLAIVTDDEELAQCAEVVLGTNKGEWFLDPDAGLDFSLLLGKVVIDEVATEAIRTALQQEDRITSVESVTFERVGRQLAATATIAGGTGSVEVKVNVD